MDASTISTLTAEGVSTVYGMGFMLVVASWAIGAKIGIALGVIKKL